VSSESEEQKIKVKIEELEIHLKEAQAKWNEAYKKYEKLSNLAL
jgi:hypothetical protein